MGNYNLSISGLGSHSPHVPDEQKDAGWAEVEARSLIERLLAAGHQIGEAFLAHWPGTAHEVRENLITGEKTPIGASAVAAGAGTEPASAPIADEPEAVSAPGAQSQSVGGSTVQADTSQTTTTGAATEPETPATPADAPTEG